MRKIIFVVLILAVGANASAEIKTTKSLKKGIEEANNQTLVVFDIDDTLLTSPQMLGSIPWFYDNLKKLEMSTHNKNVAEMEAVEKWNQIHKVSSVEPVEKDNAQWIANLQAKGIKTMALTAREVKFAQRTIDQLKSIGIDFSRTPIAKGNGILFVGGKIDKGEALLAFLNSRKKTFWPAKVIYFDDRLRHVEELEKALGKANIAYTGYHYTRMEKTAKKYDPMIADTEAKVFAKKSRLISDKAAQKLLDKCPDLQNSCLVQQGY